MRINLPLETFSKLTIHLQKGRSCICRCHSKTKLLCLSRLKTENIEMATLTKPSNKAGFCACTHITLAQSNDLNFTIKTFEA